MDPSQFRSIEVRWFSPLQMLELDACSRCQECVSVCPVVLAGFPDGAMERIADWQRVSEEISGRFIRRGKKDFDPACLSKISSTLARCSSCNLCAVVCESGISTASLWEAMRGACVEAGLREPQAEQTAASIMETKNPYLGDPDARTSWIPSSARLADTAPVAFFPGCTIAYRRPDLGQAALRILEKADIPYCILGNEEFCCGSFLFRTGFGAEYSDPIISMIQSLQSRGVTTLLVSCAGCLKTITLDWPRVYGGPLPFQPVSFTSYVRDLIRERRIILQGGRDTGVVYHDPCHSGRHLMHILGRDLVFEAPRDVLSAIPGVRVLEFVENREFQSCCGAGGGVKKEDQTLAHEIASQKLSQLTGLDAEILATTCPFCVRNFRDISGDHKGSLEILDVIELVDRAI